VLCVMIITHYYEKHASATALQLRLQFILNNITDNGGTVDQVHQTLSCII
jgi:hypothetical protein